MKNVVLIGGGFCGTMTAVNLSRLGDQPMRVTIVNAKRPLGGGTAYGTTRREHILNVAARNMSALPDFPLHFFDWLRTRSEFISMPEKELREMFVSRAVYGDYLRGLLTTCTNPIDARCQVQVETIADEAVDIDVLDEENADVHLRGGSVLPANQIVLATGNQPPGAFPADSPLSHDDRYCPDPWSNWVERVPPPGGKIILLGTGLTMVDVILTLKAINWEGEVVAVSRNGMLPKSHFRGIAYEDYLPENAAELGLGGLKEVVEEHCQRLKRMSQNPAIAIDKLRPHTQRLWRGLSIDEKRTFLQQHAAEWNVTRHRIATSIHETITDALDCGRLKIVAGSIDRLIPRDHTIDVQVRTADGEETALSGDLMINCTGPGAHFSKTPLPLFENLLQKQLVRCDELDMGIEVDDDFAVLNGDGQSSRMMYAVGPLLKGSLWETTAVPELRGQAMRVAEILLQREPVMVEEEDVIEYYI